MKCSYFRSIHFKGKIILSDIHLELSQLLGGAELLSLLIEYSLDAHFNRSRSNDLYQNSIILKLKIRIRNNEIFVLKLNDCSQ